MEIFRKKYEYQEQMLTYVSEAAGVDVHAETPYSFEKFLAPWWSNSRTIENEIFSRTLTLLTEVSETETGTRYRSVTAFAYPHACAGWAVKGYSIMLG